MSKNPKDYPTSPAPETTKKTGFLGKLKEKMREPDATDQSNRQLRLNVEREKLKTEGFLAKRARPSKFANLVYGGPPQKTSYGRMPRQRQMVREDSSLLSMGSQSSGFLTSPSSGDGLLDMVGTGRQQPPSKAKKYQKSGFDEMFGVG